MHSIDLGASAGKRPLFIVVFLLTLTLLPGCGISRKDSEQPAATENSGELPHGAVARVNEVIITREELAREAQSMKYYFSPEELDDMGLEDYRDIELMAVRELVSFEVAYQKAQAMDIRVSSNEVREQVDEIKKEEGSGFKAMLWGSGMTEKGFNDMTRKGMVVDKLIVEVTKNLAPVKDEELLAYYLEYQADYYTPENRRISQILIENASDAKGVLARLRQGEDFAALATELSIDFETAESGGDLGWHAAGESLFPPEFEAAYSKMEAGEISGPVETEFGYHIIKVTAVNPARQESFEDVKEEIREYLDWELRQPEFETWLDREEDKYDIVYAPDFQPEDEKRSLPVKPGSIEQMA